MAPRERSAWSIAVLVVFLWLSCSVELLAQYTVGRVEGIVADSSGAVLSGANVTLRNIGTNTRRTFTSDRDGTFVFFAIPPGRYELSAQAKGFGRRTVEIDVFTNQTTAQNLVLNVGQESRVIEVESTTPGQVNAVDAQRAVTRTELEVSDLPTLGRNMMTLVHLAPGVTPTNNPRGGTTFGGGGSFVIILGVQSGLIAANGGRARATSVQLDYTDANDWEGGGFAPGMQAVSPDMLQEFKILTSNFSAEYGVKSNAQVMMTTKSGSNAWHGTAYDFLQNDFFNGRDYFDRTGRASPIKQNIYGVTSGGPLVKDRIFFFAGYEGRKTRGGSFTTLATVPSAAARGRATDPEVIDLMDRFLPPATRSTGDPSVGTVAVQIPSPVDTYQFVVRVDDHLSSSHTLSARYLQSIASFVARYPSQNSLPGFDADNHFTLHNVNITDTLVLSPSTVNELRLAYARSSADGLPQGDLSVPRFIILGTVNFGPLQSLPATRLFNVYQINEILSHVHGRHVLKFGEDFRNIQDNSLNATNSRGVFTFSSVDKFLAGRPTSWTRLFGNTYRGFRTSVYGFFLQDDWRVTPTLTLNLGTRWEIQGGLSEARDLTAVLDPGTSGSIGAAGPGPLGSFRLGGDAVSSNPGNLAPRVGFAWNPHSGNLVVRGGYGMYWDSFTFTSLAAARFVPPFDYTFTLGARQISGANSFDNLLNGTAPILAQAQAQVGGFGNLKNFGSITTVDPNLSNPYVQHFSLGLEYRIANGYVATLSYVGTKGTHLTRLIPINPVVGGPASAVSPRDEITRLAQFQAAFAAENGPGNNRLDPRFDQVNLQDAGASSIYHSLQAELKKSLSHGLQFQASYTWSKSIDDASDFNPTIQANDNSFAQDNSNPRGERAVSNFDITHRLLVTGIWQFPFFHSQSGWRRKVFDGWSFESVNMWQTGIPATLLAGTRLGIPDVNLDGNLIPTGMDNTRADCVAGGIRFQFGNPVTIPAPSQRGVNGAPNSSNFAYTQPLLGNNGTCGRNNIRMNSLTNFDWSMFKNIELTESGPFNSGPWNLQFRAEFYNIFNIPFLTAQGDAWRTVASPAFGLYNAAGATRKMQFALRLTW